MNRRFLLFLAASGSAALVNIGSRLVFDIWLPYLPSIVLAYLVGMATAFLLNRALVFRDRPGEMHAQAAWFVVVNVFAVLQTVVISLVLARWVLPRFGVPHADTVAHIIGVAAPAVTSYIAHNRLTFRHKSGT
ncbi:GtrA family protein [Lysobacter tyrosinilyticus]